MKISPRYIIAGITVAITTLVSVGAHYFLAPNDGPIQEVAESIIESQLEQILNLPAGSCRDCIDLTP